MSKIQLFFILLDFYVMMHLPTISLLVIHRMWLTSFTLLFLKLVNCGWFSLSESGLSDIKHLSWWCSLSSGIFHWLTSSLNILWVPNFHFTFVFPFLSMFSIPGQWISKLTNQWNLCLLFPSFHHIKFDLQSWYFLICGTKNTCDFFWLVVLFPFFVCFFYHS